MTKGCKICQYLRLIISGLLLGCIVWVIVLHFAYGIKVAIWLWAAVAASVLLTIWSVLDFKRAALKTDFNDGVN